jgi:hypothetical protein
MCRMTIRELFSELFIRETNRSRRNIFLLCFVY